MAQIKQDDCKCFKKVLIDLFKNKIINKEFYVLRLMKIKEMKKGCKC